MRSDPLWRCRRRRRTGQVRAPPHPERVGRQDFPDVLAADPAERKVQGTHPTVEFWPKAFAVKIVSSLEEANCAFRYRARQRAARIASCTVGVSGSRDGGCGRDKGSPLQRRSTSADGDVNLGGFSKRVIVPAGLPAGASLKILVLISETECRMAHLVKGDLLGTRRERVNPHGPAGSPIDGRVDYYQHRMHLRHLGDGSV